MNLIQAIEERKSIRGFLDRPVPGPTIQKILHTARWSPSGVNLQPWRVEVAMGRTLVALRTRLTALAGAGEPKNPDYQFYPDTWKEPYLGRRRATGFGLLEAMGIRSDDAEARRQAFLANYSFFGAPVALLLFMDRSMGQGAWMDMGMFFQTVMLTAHAHGLGSCPQAAVADYPDAVRELLHVDHQYILLGCLAMGYPDPQAKANTLRT
ncbi:MAG TPA: nitroreductase, partial [Magnetococcales bacterium]|nr:nitroreductase [Magnetococcales bacterium]